MAMVGTTGGGKDGQGKDGTGGPASKGHGGGKGQVDTEILIPPLGEAWNVEEGREFAFTAPQRSRGRSKAGHGLRRLPEVSVQSMPDAERLMHITSVADEGGDEDEGGDDGANDDDNTLANPRVDGPLEASMQSLPFEQYDVLRGVSRYSTAPRRVGQLKARVRVIEIARRNLYPKPVKLRDIFFPLPYVVRVYITRGLDLAAKDASGSSDPFLILENADGKGHDHYKDFVNDVQKGTLNPDFYTAAELRATLPGDASLTIKVMDWDLLGTELIGETKIDLETRLFAEEWVNMPIKPIETRSLYHPSSHHDQGKLELWVEIMPPEQALQTPITEIKPPQPARYTLRVIVWRCKDVVVDGKEEADIFCSVNLLGQPTQQSDVHPNAHNKHNPPEFNWRYVFPIDVHVNTMSRNPNLKLAIWDRTYVGANDALAEAILDLGPVYARALDQRRRQKSQDRAVRLNDQWIQCNHPSYEGVRGRVLCSLELVPRKDHDEFPVGYGRGFPNENPKLKKPVRAGWLTVWMRRHARTVYELRKHKREVAMGFAFFVVACVMWGMYT